MGLMDFLSSFVPVVTADECDELIAQSYSSGFTDGVEWRGVDHYELDSDEQVEN